MVFCVVVTFSVGFAFSVVVVVVVVLAKAPPLKRPASSSEINRAWLFIMFSFVVLSNPIDWFGYIL
jgi:hypothetical protein